MGAIPSMLLAIVADVVLVRLQRRLTPWDRATAAGTVGRPHGRRGRPHGPHRGNGRLARRPRPLGRAGRDPAAPRRAPRRSRRRRSLLAWPIALPIGLSSATRGRRDASRSTWPTSAGPLPSCAVIAIVLPMTTVDRPAARVRVHTRRSSRWSCWRSRRSSSTRTSASRASTATSSRRPAGMGMRERQVLRRVEIPVALPVIVGGIRIRGRPDRRDGNARGDLRLMAAWAAT